MLNNRVALVTGSGRGIGRSIAEYLAAKGAKIVVSDVMEEAGNETVEIIKKEGGEAIFIKADVSSLNDVENLVKEATEKFGSLDILVNNAGITKDNLIMRMTEDEWDRVININLKGVFNCTKAVTRVMMKQKYGRIINISSVVGIMGNAGQINYSASKAGVIGMTKSTAKELASRNITANVIAPGFIRSEMTDKLTDDVKTEYMKNIPLKKFGDPLDIAKAIAFLASDDAAYITGQVLAVDGGMTM